MCFVSGGSRTDLPGLINQLIDDRLDPTNRRDPTNRLGCLRSTSAPNKTSRYILGLYICK